VARVIEETTPLNELQSRGLVPRLLKQTGLQAEDVAAQQLIVVGRKLLSEVLKKNGVDDTQPIVARWIDVCGREADTARVNDGVWPTRSRKCSHAWACAANAQRRR
jgi:hypothetical protein